ncbi:MAG: hypothetical protein FJZ08_05435 [Candidatus Omnitrophica bacterium]|nr:hypothetical protein [Candidatus Omnitrophota bacterium]
MYFCASPNEALWLLVLGLGYIVLLKAKKEGGGVRKIGLIISTFLVVFAGLTLAANLLLKAKFLYKGCPFSRSEPSSFIKEQDSPELNFPIKK